MAPYLLLLLLFSHCQYLNLNSRLNNDDLRLNLLDQDKLDQSHHLQQQQQQHRLQHQILLSGDIHSHPGPRTPKSTTPSTASGKKPRKVSFPCTVCDGGVTKASKAVSCDICERWTHVRCSPSLSLAAYDRCVKGEGELAFVCDQCSFSSLPFAGELLVDSDNSTLPSAPSSSIPTAVPPPTPPQSLSSKGLHFVHANVRSLLPKLPEIRLFLSRTRAAVFAASETWLDPTVNDGEIQIPGFNVLRRDRNRNGGGVALFIRNGIAFNPRPDLAVDDLEATWVELLPPKSKGILVCSIYRPPGDSNFLSKLELSLSKINPGTEVFVLGDFNIDLQRQSSPLFSRYKDILDSFNLDQLISEPTRIASNSSSLIDHVLTNVGGLVENLRCHSSWFQ